MTMSTLQEDEAQNITIEQEREEHKKICQEICQGVKEARRSVQELIQELENGGTEEGISFLDMKNRLLLSYNTNLAYLMLKKSQGKAIEGDKAIDRLVENRTVLEKSRQIDHKLKYQVDKLVSIAENGFISEDDPLRFKPNPDQLMSKFGGGSSDEENDDDESGDAANQKFKPPQNVPQFYDAIKTNEEIAKDDMEKRKKRAISKSIMEDLKDQYLDTPEEVSHKADTMRKKLIEEERERTRIEEENFIRLPVTKADRVRRRQMMTTSGNIGDEITSFGRSNFDNSDMPDRKRKKSSSHQGKHAKKKGKKFKKRH